MHRIRSLLGRTGFHLFLFVVGLVLFCWPFGSDARSREIGSMFVYLFLVWSLLIVLLFLISMNVGRPSDTDPAPGVERDRDV